MEKITIKDVAKACGVGVSTVSRAINNDPNINEETKQQVLKVIEELGYVPNNSARNLKRSEGRAIAVLVKGMTNPFFNVMIKIMEEDIIAHGYSMVLQHVDPVQDEADVALGLTMEKRLAGIIFLGGIVTRTGEKLGALPVPYVVSTIGAPLTGISLDAYSSVAVDDEAEGKRATEYLIGKGCKKIAIFAGAEDDTSVGMLRLAGYRKAHAEHGLQVDESLIRYLSPENSEYSYETGYLQAMCLMDERAEFDAVFAIADVMAVGALRAFSERGRKVPKDIALIGFDGIDLTRYCTPAITTVVQPIKQIAASTSSILFNVLEGKAHKHITFDCKIAERETT